MPQRHVSGDMLSQDGTQGEGQSQERGRAQRWTGQAFSA